jgi:DNA-binding MarR family transcriptional regulator
MAEIKTDTAAPPGLRDWPGFQVFKAGWWVLRRIEDELPRVGLRGKHFLVLTMLGADETLSQQQMATYMSLDPTQMVALIDELEEADLVRRSPDPKDRRRHALSLTSEGRSVLKKAKAIVDEIDEEIFAPLNSSERGRLSELVEQLMEPYWSDRLVPPRQRSTAKR